MYGLTLKQPWAAMVLRFDKRIENRSWRPYIALPARIAVHAGRAWDDAGASTALRVAQLTQFDPAHVMTGLILGTVELAAVVEVVAASDEGPVTFNVVAGALEGLKSMVDVMSSAWRDETSPFAWVLREPRLLREPIKHRGQQGLWRVPANVEREILAQEGATDAIT